MTQVLRARLGPDVLDPTHHLQCHGQQTLWSLGVCLPLNAAGSPSTHRAHRVHHRQSPGQQTSCHSVTQQLTCLPRPCCTWAKVGPPANDPKQQPLLVDLDCCKRLDVLACFLLYQILAAGRSLGMSNRGKARLPQDAEDPLSPAAGSAAPERPSAGPWPPEGPPQGRAPAWQRTTAGWPPPAA